MSTQQPDAPTNWLHIYMNESEWSFNKIVVGGLVAFSLIIVQAFISTKIEDVAEWISVAAFAIAIPLLVMFIFVYGMSTIPVRTSTFAGVLYRIGLLIDICGLDAAFWHVSRIAGLLFMLSGLLALVVYGDNVGGTMRKHAETPTSNQPPTSPTP